MSTEGFRGEHLHFWIPSVNVRFKTLEQAVSYALSTSRSGDASVCIEVVVFSEEGARRHAGEDGVRRYQAREVFAADPPPGGTIFERIYIRCDIEPRYELFGNDYVDDKAKLTKERRERLNVKTARLSGAITHPFSCHSGNGIFRCAITNPHDGIREDQMHGAWLERDGVRQLVEWADPDVSRILCTADEEFARRGFRTRHLSPIHKGWERVWDIVETVFGDRACRSRDGDTWQLMSSEYSPGRQLHILRHRAYGDESAYENQNLVNEALGRVSLRTYFAVRIVDDDFDIVQPDKPCGVTGCRRSYGHLGPHVPLDSNGEIIGNFASSDGKDVPVTS